jgi:hypothetical protein
MRSDGFGSFEGMDGKGGTKPSIDADLDTMRDVYMLPSQQAAFDRLATALRALRDAPVVRFYAGDTEDAFLVNTPEEAAAIPQGGTKVRLVPLDTTAGVDRG